jgi:hypothetical protein
VVAGEKRQEGGMVNGMNKGEMGHMPNVDEIPRSPAPGPPCRLQQDDPNALVGYPTSHFKTILRFLGGQFQHDSVGPCLEDRRVGAEGEEYRQRAVLECEVSHSCAGGVPCRMHG